MKSKKTIYLLLPLVLLIWGLLGYRLYSFFRNEEVLVEENTSFQTQNIDYKTPDSVKIAIDYRDPFSGNLKKDNSFIRKTTTSISNPKAQVSSAVVNEPIKPVIIYKGLVSDTKDKNKVFMFSVDNKTYLLEKGQIENDIKVISGDGKQITLLINKKKEVVEISK